MYGPQRNTLGIIGVVATPTGAILCYARRLEALSHLCQAWPCHQYMTGGSSGMSGRTQILQPGIFEEPWNRDRPRQVLRMHLSSLEIAISNWLGPSWRGPPLHSRMQIPLQVLTSVFSCSWRRAACAQPGTGPKSQGYGGSAMTRRLMSLPLGRSAASSWGYSGRAS